MARIIISYYWKSPDTYKGTHNFFDGLAKALQNNGNDVLIMNASQFNGYTSNTVNAPDIDKIILDKAKEFNPELIIAFNHRIPQCILDNFKDIPTVIYDGDELNYFCDLDYIKENIKRYTVFSIVKDWEKDYLDFGFDKKQIHYMPAATAITAKNIPQDKNISFIGSIHYAKPKLIKMIKKGEYNDKFSGIIQEYLNSDNKYDYEKLSRKYLGETYDESELTLTDLYPIFNFRIITLINLIDLGLHLRGPQWNKLTEICPQLVACWNKDIVYTLDENEDFYNSSKISLAPIHPQARGVGFPWRVFDVMASNACLVCEQSSDLKELTKNYLDIPTFNTPWEARDICKELLKDNKARKEIVTASQKYVNENARWEHRFKEMENILDIKLLNSTEKGRLINLSEDEDFAQTCNDYRKKAFKNRLSFRNKIRYKIWNHFNKVLKKKRIIK